MANMLGIGARSRTKYLLVVAFAVVVVQPTPANGGTITWVDWSSSTSSSVLGTIAATVTGPPKNVTFGGHAAVATQIAGATGTNYWMPSTPYLSATVDNAPPCCEMIASTEGGVTFGLNKPFNKPLLMAIFSLGEPGQGVTYTFQKTFQLLSGDAGTFIQTGPKTLTGFGGSGVIQFTQPSTTIEWKTSPSPPGDWAGLQIGIAQTIPDSASTLFLFAAALAVLASLCQCGPQRGQ